MNKKREWEGETNEIQIKCSQHENEWWVFEQNNNNNNNEFESAQNIYDNIV